MKKNCGDCNYWRIDRHCGGRDDESIDGADVDKPLCNLNGKYIKYDENDYPINCLMRFQE